MALCAVDDCDREVGRQGARGWCTKHLQRFYVHGDPTVVTHRGKWMAGRTETASNTWKGDAVKYRGAHMRLSRKYGHPKECRFCDRTGPGKYAWALRHDAGDVIVDEQGRAYSSDPADYIRLCVPCHNRYDH